MTEKTEIKINKESIGEAVRTLAGSTPGLYLAEGKGISREYVGTRMYEAPIIGYGSADDALFKKYKEIGVIGPWHMSPDEWLPGARTIVSMFFPFSEAVLETNRKMHVTGSKIWAYARIEGQAYIGAFTAALRDWFTENGAEACAPCVDGRFGMLQAGKGSISGYDEVDERTFGSRWSERHAAYVSGLGTFSLSKGLITERGIAGRFTSVVTDAALEPDERPYSGLDDYCIKCGACIKRCPAKAISMESGKDHSKCFRCVNISGVIHHPRYGCGLCQTGVPCETRNPNPSFRK